jgi:hypothetical protein
MLHDDDDTAAPTDQSARWPIVPAIRVRDRRGDRLVVCCPHCQKPHWHGVASLRCGAGDGHRVADCKGPADCTIRGYIVREDCRRSPQPWFSFKRSARLVVAASAHVTLVM